MLERSSGRFVLCGYSLGGRIALHVALAAPSPRKTTGARLEHRRDRGSARSAPARRASDELLAEELERGPFDEFVERWRSQPLFADDPPEVRERAREDQLRNAPAGLAASLRGVGAGRMEPLWDRLGELTMPVLSWRASATAEYRELGERIAARLPDARLTVLPGGHALALESPAALARALDSSFAASGGPTPRPGPAGTRDPPRR